MRPLYAHVANGFTLQKTTNVRCGAYVIVTFMYDVRGILLIKVNDEVTTELFYYFFETMCFQTSCFLFAKQYVKRCSVFHFYDSKLIGYVKWRTETKDVVKSKWTDTQSGKER